MHFKTNQDSINFSKDFVVPASKSYDKSNFLELILVMVLVLSSLFVSALPITFSDKINISSDITPGITDSLPYDNTLINDKTINADFKLSVSIVTDWSCLPDKLVLNAGGSSRFAPPCFFSGIAEVIYILCNDESRANCATGTLYILVEPALIAPIDLDLVDVSIVDKGMIASNEITVLGTRFCGQLAYFSYLIAV